MKLYTLNEAWSILDTELSLFKSYYSEEHADNIPLPTIHDVLDEWRDNYSKLSVARQAAYDRLQQETGTFNLPVKAK
jgi:hypothetical protein